MGATSMSPKITVREFIMTQNTAAAWTPSKRNLSPNRGIRPDFLFHPADEIHLLSPHSFALHDFSGCRRRYERPVISPAFVVYC
jgi:hypothetical protein